MQRISVTRSIVQCAIVQCAMRLGIPAITIDGGGRGSGAHSLGEAFDATESWKGTQRAVLVAIALAQR